MSESSQSSLSTSSSSTSSTSSVSSTSSQSSSSISSSSSTSSSSQSTSSSGRYSLSNAVVVTTDYFCLTATRKHTTRYSLLVKDASGADMVFNETDVIRIKIGRAGFPPVLDLDSNAATAGGSSVTSTNPIALTLDQDDLTMEAAVYDIEMLVMDDSSGTLVTHVAAGIFILAETQLGDFAVT